MPTELESGHSDYSLENISATARSESFGVRDVVAAYNAAALRLFDGYERIPFGSVHREVADLLPESSSSVLDVGAGSGRDAAWFAQQGHNVVAVEPSAGMREAGGARHKSSKIRWLDDNLPALNKVLRTKSSFDLVWVSAVWHHLPASQRHRAFRKLVSVLSPGGSMMISLRQGPPAPGRPMEPATSAEIERLARRHGLQVIRVTKSADASRRKGVSWEIVWLQLPDDGTGALPLLRHVVFNDRKSSTYKLALLRALLRIADGAAGFARSGANDDQVDLPIGLVALFWIRSYQPLINANLPQGPGGNQHLGLVNSGFLGLMDRSPFDLRVGQRFNEKDAENLILAIRGAANLIRKMPANFITYPGSDKPVFPYGRGGSVRVKNSVSIDEAFLWSFGSFSVPRNLWQAMGRYAAWLEPAVLNEWIRMMRGYEQRTSKGKQTWDSHWKALKWLTPEHDTDIARRRAKTLRTDGLLYCVWTGKHLTRRYEIDHCFPFAAWPCNDLWNLLPSSRQTNQKKSDQLPSPDALDSAKPRVLEWWHSAYQRDIGLKETFEDEARSALPATGFGDDDFTLESVFDGLMFQRLVLKRDQQLREWQPAQRAVEC